MDEPWVLGSTWRQLDLDKNEAYDRAGIGDWGGVGGLPSNGEEVAVGLEGELLEVDRGLLALAGLEGSAVGEAGREERERDRGSALRAGVDE